MSARQLHRRLHLLSQRRHLLGERDPGGQHGEEVEEVRSDAFFLYQCLGVLLKGVLNQSAGSFQPHQSHVFESDLLHQSLNQISLSCPLQGQQ